jgi:regulator of protease activity HflC (stomatin/prohibitin superfamily)
MNTIGKISIGAGISAVLAFLFWMVCFTTVDKGHVGIRTTWGAVGSEELKPGLHFKIPVMHGIREINTQQANATSSCHGASKDLQQVDTDVSLLYVLDATVMCEAYDRIGDREAIEAKILQPAINETFKAVNARYTAEELITKRAEVSIEVRQQLETFIKRSCEIEGLATLIRLDNMAIEDFRFSNEFNAAIEAKVTAEQEAFRAEKEKDRTITQAEAKKEEVRLASEAKALEIENQAKAQAFQIESESIARAEAITREALAIKNNSELITLRKVENWDGKLPVYMMGNGGGDGIGLLLNVPQHAVDGGN